MSTDFIQDMNDYNERYFHAKTSPETYWNEIGHTFEWFKPFTKIHSGNFEDLNVKWFEDGELNITVNCLDRHLKTKGDKVAIIWEPNDPKDPVLKLTYKELHQNVCKMANVLKANGIQKGDRVCFYMSMVPELLYGVLATARIGAIHSVVFGGFSAQALAGRIQDCEAKMVITNDEAYRGDKIIPLKNICDEALQTSPCVETVLVEQRTKGKVSWNDSKDKWLHEELSKVSDSCEPEVMKAEDPLFILYTSGSTGKPKGLLHTTAGYMAWASETFKQVFQVDEKDIFWCSADIGWITGHSYIAYGPLLNGVTNVMFEGVPTWPDPGRFWEVIDKHQVTHFYTAPTAIRALEACDLEYVTKHKLNTLKVLGSVGEPINEEAWQWYHKNIGKSKCPIVDTWWQTETGGIMISPLAGVTECIPSFATFPLPGVRPQLVDSEGKILEGNPNEGNLCIEKPWPGMARTIWGDHNRYKETYFSTYKGYYFTGDGAKRDTEGRYRITGRVDDVLNVSGHRIGTAEVEDAINEHPLVVESAIVGYPHNIKGQGIYAYVISQSKDAIDEDKLKKELDQLITKIIGPIAKPDLVQIVSGLPKTRSGKIMRRILRKIAEKDLSNLGDTSTLLNPEVVEEIKKGFKG